MQRSQWFDQKIASLQPPLNVFDCRCSHDAVGGLQHDMVPVENRARWQACDHHGRLGRAWLFPRERVLHERSHVTIIARTKSKLDQAIVELQEMALPEVQVQALTADVTQYEQERTTDHAELPRSPMLV